jgi:hypothetical protein
MVPLNPKLRRPSVPGKRYEEAVKYFLDLLTDAQKGDRLARAQLIRAKEAPAATFTLSTVMDELRALTGVRAADNARAMLLAAMNAYDGAETHLATGISEPSQSDVSTDRHGPAVAAGECSES